jgi:hypothetical protein
MKKFALAATAAAIASAFGGAAFAADVSVNPPTFDTYASERLSAGLQLTGEEFRHKLGFGVSTGQSRYVRYDLTNATFGTDAVDNDDLQVAAGGTGTSAVSQGGANGQSFVVMQLTANSDLSQDQVVFLNIDSLKITNTSSNVTMRVRLYSGPAEAQAGGTAGLLYEVSGTQVGIASGLTVTTTPFKTTASVATEYKDFKATAAFAPTDGFVTTTKAKLGALTHKVTPLILDENGNLLTMNQIITGAIVTVAGDLSKAASVNASVDNCATLGAAFTINAGKTAATLDVGTNEFDPVSVCFTSVGGQPIPAANYDVSVDVTPAANTNTTDRGPLMLGSIVHDGTVLKHAFAEGAASGTGFSTAVNLTNLSGAAAPYTVRCLLNNGSAAGTPGTVPANTAVRLGLANSIGCTQSNLRAIELTFAVPEGNVIGAVVRQNTSTGTASFDTMIGSK